MKLSRSHLAGIAVIAGLFLFGIGIPYNKEQNVGVCSLGYSTYDDIRAAALRTVFADIGAIELGPDNPSPLLQSLPISIAIMEERTYGAPLGSQNRDSLIASYLFDVNGERIIVGCKQHCRCEIFDGGQS